MGNSLPVHSYGVPQVFSQWQAASDEKQRRIKYQQAFKLKEEEVKLRQDQFAENKKNNESVRRIAVGNKAFKLFDLSSKYMKNPRTYSMGKALQKKGLEDLNAAYGGGLNIESLQGLSDKAFKEDFTAQFMENLNTGVSAYLNGDEKAGNMVKNALIVAQQNDSLDPEVIKMYQDMLKTKGRMTDEEKNAAKIRAAEKTAELERQKYERSSIGRMTDEEKNAAKIRAAEKTAEIERQKYERSSVGRMTDEEKNEAKIRAAERAVSPTNYLLKDRSTVISLDNGRTYKGKDGRLHEMPSDAVKISANVTGEDMSMFEAKRQAKEELFRDGVPPTDGTVPPDGATSPKKYISDTLKKAETATGLHSGLQAFLDNVGGAFGIPALVGKEGFFPDTQENRQTLQVIKQLGKTALMSSSRGAVWEQKQIMKLFPNPGNLFINPKTEAKKLLTLRTTLQETRQFNNQAIGQAITPKEVAKLRESNMAIDRLLLMIGTGKSGGETVVESSGSYPMPDDDSSLVKQYIGR